ncbi:MAG: DUF3078 domain-containing protein [Bacteroidales bacterium]|nr:DUF3078 domain-containing protein [Bacteroidales bacterium]
MKKVLAFAVMLIVLDQVVANIPENIYTFKSDSTSSADTVAGIPDSLKLWDISTQVNLSFNQVSFSDWAEGGENTFAGVTFGNFKADYTKNKFEVDNYVKLAYGLNWTSETGFRKTDDKIDFGSHMGYNAFKHWYYTSVITFKTQFSKGYKYPNDSVIVSGFLAPANLYLSYGLEYKPS